MQILKWMCVMVCFAGSAAAQPRPPLGGVRAATDTLRLTRRQAIATALMANPQIEIARQQTLQVRAQRVEGIAIRSVGSDWVVEGDVRLGLEFIDLSVGRRTTDEQHRTDGARRI